MPPRKQNRTAPQQKRAEPQQDGTEPQQNGTEPPQNRTEPQVNHSKNGDSLIKVRAAAMRDADLRHGTIRPTDGHPADSRNGGTSHDQIAQMAYELWVARGRRHGSDWQDWHDAEQRLGVSSSADKQRS